MSDLNHNRVLLVDDDEDVREVLAMLLESLGVTVVAAESGPRALELYRPNTFDVVFTDYNMPAMTGDELARAIKTQNPAQRVVMVSGSLTEACQQSFPPFVDQVVSKPCTVDQLSAGLNSTPKLT